jgi:hypothetical protein
MRASRQRARAGSKVRVLHCREGSDWVQVRADVRARCVMVASGGVRGVGGFAV